MIDADDLPDGWALAEIEEVTTQRVEQGEPTADADFTYIDIGSLDNVSKQIAEPKVIPGATAPSRARQIVQLGDVLVSMTRPNLNAVAIVPASLAGSIASTGFHVLRPTGVLSEWLFSVVRSSTFVQAMSDLVQGALYPAVRPDDIRGFQIPIPPLAEQHRIVKRIEALEGRTHKAREALAEIPTLLEQYRQSLLASAFQGGLTAYWREQHPDVEPASALLDRIRQERRRLWEAKNPRKKYVEPEPVDDSDLPVLPEGWTWASIEEVATDVVDCPHSTPKWTASGWICVRTTEFTPGKLELSGAQFVSEQTYQERIARLKPAANDVLYSREGGILGIACVVPQDVDLCMGQRMMLIRPASGIASSFIMWWLNSPFLLSVVKRLTLGTASPHLNVGDVKLFPVPVPPESEQMVLVGEVQKLLSASDRISAAVDSELEQISLCSQAILAKAFRGELVDQDPADEPASALLDRIKATRESNNGTVRKVRRNRT